MQEATAEAIPGKRAKPMPRKQRRAQLLGVARRIVHDGGIGALTMSGLAEQSGASKPVVYEHFQNSEAVAVALLEDYFRTMIELVANRAKKAETLEEYLSIAVDAQFEFHTTDRLVVRSITNGHSSSERVNAIYRDMRDHSVETLQELLSQQGASDAESETAGYLLWEMISSAVFEFAMAPNADAKADTLKKMLIGAVHAVVPEAKARPVTPAKILEAARAMRQPKT